MKTCDPQEARQRFKVMKHMNWGITIGVFIFLVLALHLFFNFFFADIIAIAVAFCLYFFFLNKRFIAIYCKGCGKIIETNTPWICGACGAKIRRVYDYPFIHQCASKFCNYEPKAYRCHHADCGKPIFLSEDKSEINIARCLNMPETPQPVKKKKENKIYRETTELQEGIQIGKLKVEKAKIDLELIGLKENLEPKKTKTAFEELEEYYKGMMGNEDAAKKWHAAIDAEFPDDKDEREKRHQVVDQWMTNRL